MVFLRRQEDRQYPPSPAKGVEVLYLPALSTARMANRNGESLKIYGPKGKHQAQQPGTRG